MLPLIVIKVGVENTCFGLAVVLTVDGQRTLAFPQQIDSTDRDEIDNYHPTICWPMGEPLTNIREFPPGPLLPGWDILGAFSGRIGEDPWMEFGITPINRKSEVRIEPVLKKTHSEPVNSAHHTNTAFDFAVYVVKKMNRPHWVIQFITKLRLLQLVNRRR